MTSASRKDFEHFVALLPGASVMSAVRHVLNGEGGRTIGEIEQARGRDYPAGDASGDLRDEPVWFALPDVIHRAAETLQLDPGSQFGSRKSSGRFGAQVTNQISALRSRGRIKDWKKGLGIFHLTADSVTMPDVDPGSLRGAHPAETVHVMPTAGLAADFISILTQGRKSNTYKFALARALIEYCRDSGRDAGRGDAAGKMRQRDQMLTIPYRYLAERFLAYYWHQECRLHLQQNFRPDAKPHATQIISKIFGSNAPGSFDSLKPRDRDEAVRRILKTVFGNTEKTSNVVPRFQNIRSGKSTIPVRSFYDYDDDAQTITLKPEAFAFFQEHHALLSKAVVVEWTKFLEPINKNLPMLTAKIEGLGAARRQPLTEYRRILFPHDDSCFYCRAKLEPGSIHVDHLIPWSYMFDDNIWNLVLACRRCNCNKSNSLPQEEFLDELVARNTAHQHDIPKLCHSLELLDRGRGWEAEIASHYKTCGEYGFGRVRLP